MNTQLQNTQNIKDKIKSAAQASSKTMCVEKIDFGEIIYSYTRKQAIEDGELIDVTTTAKEAGFSIPVAITRAAWIDCVEWPDGLNTKKRTSQDEAGRLWDVVYMGFLAARRNKESSSIVYGLYRVPTDGNKRVAREVSLKITINGGDNGEPVITISLPSED